MPDTILTLGGIVFQDFEIPESINFGGSQRLAVHKMIGGSRVVDAMGSDQADNSWSGRFRTSTALQRAQQIDRLRILGQPVTLSMGGISYPVLIAEFTYDYQREYEIPYRIVCTPASAETAPAQASQTIDNLVSGDTSGAGELLFGLQNLAGNLAAPLAAVSGNLSTATTLIGTLGTLAGKTGSQTASIISSLTSAQVGLQGAVSLADGNILQGVAQIGGVIPGNPTGSAGSLTGQIAALTNLSSMITARGLLGRAANNVSQAGSAS